MKEKNKKLIILSIILLVIILGITIKLIISKTNAESIIYIEDEITITEDKDYIIVNNPNNLSLEYAYGISLNEVMQGLKVEEEMGEDIINEFEKNYADKYGFLYDTSKNSSDRKEIIINQDDVYSGYNAFESINENVTLSDLYPNGICPNLSKSTLLSEIWNNNTSDSEDTYRKAISNCKINIEIEKSDWTRIEMKEIFNNVISTYESLHTTDRLNKESIDTILNQNISFGDKQKLSSILESDYENYTGTYLDLYNNVYLVLLKKQKFSGVYFSDSTLEKLNISSNGVWNEKMELNKYIDVIERLKRKIVNSSINELRFQTVLGNKIPYPKDTDSDKMLWIKTTKNDTAHYKYVVLKSGNTSNNGEITNLHIELSLDSKKTGTKGTEKLYMYIGRYSNSMNSYNIDIFLDQDGKYKMSQKSNKIQIPSSSGGEEFKGYYTQSSGGELVIDSNGYVVYDNYFNPTNVPSTLYAQWVSSATPLIINDISLDSRGADIKGTEVICVSSRDDIIENISLDCKKDYQIPNVNKIDVPTKTNYIFQGYYVNLNGREELVINSDGYVADDMYHADIGMIPDMLYARWEPTSSGGNTTTGDNNQPGGNTSTGDNNQPGGNTTTGDNNQPGGNTTTGDNNQPGGNTSTGDNNQSGGNTSTGDNNQPGGNTTTGDNNQPGGNTSTGDNNQSTNNNTTNNNTINSSNNNASINGDSTIVNKDNKFETSEVTGNDKNQIKDKLFDDAEDIYIIDTSIKDKNGNTIDLNEKEVTITLDIPKGMSSSDNLKLYEIVNGAKKEISFTIVNGKIVFKTKSMGRYVIVKYPKNSNTQNNDTIENPKTGDINLTLLIGGIVVTLIVLITSLIFIIKSRKNKVN